MVEQSYLILEVVSSLTEAVFSEYLFSMGYIEFLLGGRSGFFSSIVSCVTERRDKKNVGKLKLSHRRFFVSPVSS